MQRSSCGCPAVAFAGEREQTSAPSSELQQRQATTTARIISERCGAELELLAVPRSSWRTGPLRFTLPARQRARLLQLCRSKVSIDWRTRTLILANAPTAPNQ